MVQIVGMSTDEFFHLLDEKLDSRFKYLSQVTTPQPEIEFVSSDLARGILSGNPDRPISKPFFNELRNKGLINDYLIGGGSRVVFSRQELNEYLKSNKKPSLTA